MYESFYGFEERPFLTVPTLDRYFPASSIEAAYQTVTRAIQRSEGPVAIFGGAGLGKTMCCLRIAASVPRSFDVVTLASAQLITRRALLQSLLYELGLPCHDGSEGALRLALLERLQPSQENQSEGLVLIVDEAQTLSIKLLEELRILTNVVCAGVPRLRLVLCGTLRLEETLSHPHMESLNQRLAARCYLTPLTHDESDRYVQHKIELCGRRAEEIITSDGLEAIYRAADGIPRLIDQVADQSLLLGAKEKILPIHATVVGYAWSSLQQLPNPWSDPVPSVASWGAGESTELEGIREGDDFQDDEVSRVEFGSLEEPIDGESLDRPGAQDEFPIPIQSLRNYQSLSGVAMGGLSDERSISQESQIPDLRGRIEEATDFVGFSSASPSVLDTSGASTQTSVSPFGTGESDVGRIEQQIEDEMRHLVSNLNAEAIREHFESHRRWTDESDDDHSMLVEEFDPGSLGSVWDRSENPSNPSAAGYERHISSERDLSEVFADDRDMIHIEEEKEATGSRGPEQAYPSSKARASIHPYARLFSQLRNS